MPLGGYDVLLDPYQHRIAADGAGSEEDVGDAGVREHPTAAEGHLVVVVEVGRVGHRAAEEGHHREAAAVDRRHVVAADRGAGRSWGGSSEEEERRERKGGASAGPGPGPVLDPATVADVVGNQPELPGGAERGGIDQDAEDRMTGLDVVMAAGDCSHTGCGRGSQAYRLAGDCDPLCLLLGRVRHGLFRSDTEGIEDIQ